MTPSSGQNQHSLSNCSYDSRKVSNKPCEKKTWKADKPLNEMQLLLKMFHWRLKKQRLGFWGTLTVRLCTTETRKSKNPLNKPNVGEGTGESVGKINGFNSKVSFPGCTMHTHSNAHFPVITVPRARCPLTKKSGKKRKGHSEDSPYWFFNLAFTRAYRCWFSCTSGPLASGFSKWN